MPERYTKPCGSPQPPQEVLPVLSVSNQKWLFIFRALDQGWGGDFAAGSTASEARLRLLYGM